MLKNMKAKTTTMDNKSDLDERFAARGWLLDF